MWGIVQTHPPYILDSSCISFDGDLMLTFGLTFESDSLGMSA